MECHLASCFILHWQMYYPFLHHPLPCDVLSRWVAPCGETVLVAQKPVQTGHRTCLGEPGLRRPCLCLACSPAINAVPVCPHVDFSLPLLLPGFLTALALLIWKQRIILLLLCCAPHGYSMVLDLNRSSCTTCWIWYCGCHHSPCSFSLQGR